MAICSLTKIVVSGAGLAEVNGTYTKVGTQNGFAKYTKDGGLASNFIGVQEDMVGYTWDIHRQNINSVAYRSQSFASSALTPDCPTDPSIVWTVNNASLPLPTVAEYAPTVNPIDVRNSKYSTATEAGSARFRRLSSLGYL